MSRRAKALIVGTSLLCIGVLTPPAAADQRNFKDPANDIRSGFDLRKVRVTNSGRWIRIRTLHRNLRRGPEGGVVIYLDTQYGPRRHPIHDRGPDFAFGGGVGGPAGYEVAKIQGWRGRSFPLSCRSLRAHINYRRDTVRFAVRRGCLARAWDVPVRDVRVSVVTGVNHGRNDWGPRRHRYYRWVRRG